jgi:hypothetical protein
MYELVLSEFLYMTCKKMEENNNILNRCLYALETEKGGEKELSLFGSLPLSLSTSYTHRLLCC